MRVLAALGASALTALLALTILVALFAVLVDPTGAAARGGAILGGVVAHLLAGGAGGWAGTRLSRPRGADDGSLPRWIATLAPVGVLLAVLAVAGLGGTAPGLAAAQVAALAAGAWWGATMGARGWGDTG